MRMWKYSFLLFIIFSYSVVSYSQSKKDTILNIYFATNSHTLDSTQFSRLENFSRFSHIFSIIGYTDSIGSQDYNIRLAKRRALTVFNILSKRSDSIDNSVIKFVGESNSEPELWMNRRVLIRAFMNPLMKPKSEIADSSAIVRNFNLENVFFLPDRAIIAQESIPYIKQLAELLDRYQTETFEIIGHINYQSRLDSSHLTDLYQLSERRAKAIYDYLESSGISPSRMSYKGVGNSDPIFPSPINDEERKKNMRVQIIIRKWLKRTDSD